MSMKRWTISTIALMVLIANDSFAQNLPQQASQQAIASDNYSNIGANTLNNIKGRLAVNIVAGELNQQSNIASISTGQAAKIKSRLQLSGQLPLSGVQEVAINSGALSKNQGLISLNQSAGEANQQVNVLSISLLENTKNNFSSNDVMDVYLSNTIARNELSHHQRDEDKLTTKISLDKSALSGSAGVIQINQVAGQGNQAINMVTLPLTNRSMTSH